MTRGNRRGGSPMSVVKTNSSGLRLPRCMTKRRSLEKLRAEIWKKRAETEQMKEELNEIKAKVEEMESECTKMSEENKLAIEENAHIQLCVDFMAIAFLCSGNGGGA